MPLRLIIACFALAVVLAGCTVHRLDIQQGNVIDPAARAQLTLGMTQRQVTFLLGTPLINDPFHAARWDYVYSLQPSRGARTLQHLTLFFDGDALTRIVDEAPAPP